MEKIKNKLLVFALLLLSMIDNNAGHLYAQQLPFSSQYYTNQFVTNPALTGNHTTVNTFITHRSQWVGIPGAAQTSYLTLDGPLDIQDIGLGLKLYTNSTELISTSGALATYSYKIKLNDNNSLNLGLAMGALSNRVNYEKVKVIDVNDPKLLNQQQSKAIFSADFGLLYTWKKLEAGFVVPQMLANKINYGSFDANASGSYYSLARHYQGSVKYEFDISKKKEITAYPLFMFRAVKGAPLQYDVNAVVDWKEKGWFGLTYHSNYAVAVSAGIRYKNLCLGYAFDVGINKLRTSTGSSAEFLLGYVFKKKDLFLVDTTSGEIWADQIQASSNLIKPLDFEDNYWDELNKNIDRTRIFNAIVEAVLNGQLQAYDLLTDSPLTITQAQSFLNKANGIQAKTNRKVTVEDFSKIRTVEKWVFNKKRFALTKQVTRLDLFIKQLDEEGEYTGNDRPLFYVKLKR